MTKANPQVSVLVPCFNDDRFLDEALRSIAAQTFSEFEVVISDDASSDDSVVVAAAWVDRDRRFRLLRNEINLGMTENWNRALAEAQGAFIAKLDADDVWREETLKHLHDGFSSVPEAIATFCRTEVADERLDRLVPWGGDLGFARAGLDPLVPRVARGGLFWLLSLEEIQLWHSNASMLRREVLDQIGGFDGRWSCATDTALILRVLAEDLPVVHVPYPGVIYRRRVNSVSARFAERGWKSLEALLVRLDALGRDGRRFAPLPRTVRQSWWQAWSSFNRLRNDEDLWQEMPLILRRKLEEATARAISPPAAIRVEGWLRLQVWRMRNSIVRRAPDGVGL